MQILEELIRIIENYVEADEIKSEDTFKSDLGLSSFEIMCLIADVADDTGVTLKSSDFISNKTVGRLAEYIDSLL